MFAVELDTDGWSQAFDAARKVGEEFPEMTVAAGADQIQKVLAAIKRGDEITLSDEALEECAELYRDTVIEAMATGDLGDVEAAAQLIADRMAEDAQDSILEGRVDGPARSAAWEKRKGNSLNLAGLTGDLVASLQGAIRSR